MTECDRFVDVRGAGVIIPDTADVLGFSHTARTKYHISLVVKYV